MKMEKVRQERDGGSGRRWPARNESSEGDYRENKVHSTLYFKKVFPKHT